MMIEGKTGDYIKLLQRKALGKAGLALGGSILAFFIAFKIGFDKLLSQGIETLFVGGLLILGVVLLSVMKKHYGAYSRASVGLRSERRVAAELAKSGAAAVIHGALLGDKGGDADHIVLGPPCVVVETKTGTGKVRVTQEGFFVGSRKVPGNPVRQANRQAQALTRKAGGIRATAVVCVVDMVGQPFQNEGAWVCSLKDLRKVLANCPRVLSKDQAEQLTISLRPQS